MRKDRRKKRSAIQAAEEYGLDITLLYSNLRLTPTERLEQLKRMFRFEEELDRAADKSRLCTN
ncbi:MAG TPA: hypothetical protein VJ521_02415 [Acidobacteriota bacterium]|nr:hypothetical protein [Acidobacteriota bacterium]